MYVIFCRIQKERERSPAIAVEIGDVLPENVIVEILSWLPVKALLQFKTVCKSWYGIISSHDFIFKHLKNYYDHNDDDNHCLLAHYGISNAEIELHEFFVDEPPTVLAGQVLDEVPIYSSNVCGPCDGIYYLFRYDRALWNPAINEVKILPPIITKPNLPPNRTYLPTEVCGFGYDTITRDYKVVVLKGYCCEDHEVLPKSVLIYSFRKDSWRHWGDLTQYYPLQPNDCYIVVNGCFYWLNRGNSESIISFSMATDAIQENIQVPAYESRDDVDPYINNTLAVYDDSLAFLIVREHEKRLDIWNWNGGLWTKKFTMVTTTTIRRPIGHWKKNKFIIESADYGLFLCDPTTQEIRDLALLMGRWCYGVFAYKESLLSIKDSNKWGHHKRTEKDADHV